jgi:hypothetical protein
MKYLLLLLIPSICMSAPKFREGDIVRIIPSEDRRVAFSDEGIFYSCDKIKSFKIQ